MLQFNNTAQSPNTDNEPLNRHFIKHTSCS